ncbi:hypothetical protein [Methylomonas rivi]|uniref:Uncharacterized protein n=1 Tax=Methylomonas rivi TaxID=2952226 RepID=A0ABT1U5R5_9GAMM|nr:hypothetical protein [Methylomonas sp. WSC-6]MCQ8129194.1 hypothetical protein [Methylomonas sp. WSC-6]
MKKFLYFFYSRVNRSMAYIEQLNLPALELFRLFSQGAPHFALVGC